MLFFYISKLYLPSSTHDSSSTHVCCMQLSSMVGSQSVTNIFWKNCIVIALLPTPPSPTTTSLYVGNGWLGAWVMARRWRVNSCCAVFVANLDDSLSINFFTKNTQNRGTLAEMMHDNSFSTPQTTTAAYQQANLVVPALRDRTSARHCNG